MNGGPATKKKCWWKKHWRRGNGNGRERRRRRRKREGRTDGRTGGNEGSLFPFHTRHLSAEGLMAFYVWTFFPSLSPFSLSPLPFPPRAVKKRDCLRLPSRALLSWGVAGVGCAGGREKKREAEEKWCWTPGGRRKGGLEEGEKREGKWLQL